jgi:hypothetical protein
MNLALPLNGKFACIAIRTWVEALPDSFSLSANVLACSDAPLAVDEFWTTSLGSIQAKQVSDSNLFLIAFSSDPASDENQLKRLAESYYYGLILQGMAYSERSLILAGDIGPNGLHVVSVGWENTYRKPFKVIPPSVGVNGLAASSLLANAIEDIYSIRNGQNHLRLRKGFNTYLMAVKEHQAHFRLHHFVRAIEAVIKPETAKTRRQFVHRCQFFAGRSTDTRKLLDEIYEMRSAAEHLNPLGEKLVNYPSNEHEDLIALRTYQTELLAGYIYRKVLSDATTLHVFREDSVISELWERQDDQLIAFWGGTIALDPAVHGRFFDYLTS